jgi:hypothetical protein
MAFAACRRPPPPPAGAALLSGMVLPATTMGEQIRCAWFRSEDRIDRGRLLHGRIPGDCRLVRVAAAAAEGKGRPWPPWNGEARGLYYIQNVWIAINNCDPNEGL